MRKRNIGECCNYLTSLDVTLNSVDYHGTKEKSHILIFRPIFEPNILTWTWVGPFCTQFGHKNRFFNCLTKGAESHDHDSNWYQGKILYLDI